MYILETALFPINGIKSKVAVQFNPNVCNYTESGRAIIHDKLNKISTQMLEYLMKNPIKNGSIEFNDNRISLYTAQGGKCAVTKLPLQIGNMEAHHILPKWKGGTDKYKNLIFINSNVHRLVHATDVKVIAKYIDIIKPNPVELKKINKLREQVGNSILY